MSFGFSIGDVVLLSQLTAELITNIKHAGADFQEFSEDLRAINGVFDLIRSNWIDFETHLKQDLETADNAQLTIQTSITGVTTGLEALQGRLSKHSRKMGSRFLKAWAKKRFSQDLDVLRRRLQFHMSSLQLIASLVLLQRQQNQNAQARRVEQTISLIREGQLEQDRIDEELTPVDDPPVPDDRDSDFEETLSNFAAQFVSNRTEGTIVGTQASVSSRDIIIERWRREVELHALPEPMFDEEDVRDKTSIQLLRQLEESKQLSATVRVFTVAIALLLPIPFLATFNMPYTTVLTDLGDDAGRLHSSTIIFVGITLTLVLGTVGVWTFLEGRQRDSTVKLLSTTVARIH